MHLPGLSARVRTSAIRRDILLIACDSAVICPSELANSGAKAIVFSAASTLFSEAMKQAAGPTMLSHFARNWL
jgi:hypothetical protein